MSAAGSEDWSELTSLIDALLDTPPEQRASRIEELCAGDPVRRSALERLQQEIEREPVLFSRSAAERFAALFAGDEVGFPETLAERYRLTREVGHGGMATVYLAQDLKLGRPVAIKVLRREIAASLGAERFLREIEIAAGLTHPHILPLHDSGEAKGLLYYVMPFVEGESLRDRLVREPQLPLAEALRVTLAVADALTYAHSHGVVHRDVKPENILLSGDAVLVADFGIARAITAAGGASLTETGVAVGTPSYMSPEQAGGERQIDGRSDVYSLGCVVYEMLAGGPPFTGPSAQAILARHTLDPVPLLRTIRPELPAAVDHAVGKALAKAPADRFPSAAALSEALTQAAAPPSLALPLPRSSRRRWTRTATVAAGIIGLAAIAVVAVRRGSEREASVAPSPHSVAVLYFDNLSRDTVDAYLADGLSEEIASRLGDIPGLSVKQGSREGIRRLRETTPDYRVAAGHAFSVQYLVEGSVRRAGQQVRVEAHLVNTGNGFRAWGKTYDQSAEDLLSLEEEIARQVVIAIAGQLAPAAQAALARRSTVLPEAHEHFLRGNYYLAKRSVTGLDQAIEEYDQAARLDPRFTRAIAREAYALALSFQLGWTLPDIPRDSVRTQVATLTSRALKQDSTVSDVWLAQAYSLFLQDPTTLQGMSAALQRALLIDSRNSEALTQAGFLARIQGHDSAARALALRSLAIEPERPITLSALGLLSFLERRYVEASQWLDSSLHVNPEFYVGYTRRARVRLMLGDLGGARADAQAALRLAGADSSDGLALLAMVDVRAGDSIAARDRVRGALRVVARTYARPVVYEEQLLPIAALVVVGDRKGALSALERVRPKGAGFWAGLRAPEFDPLRGDARFQQLTRDSQPPTAPLTETP
jgi:serine/threonine protein kinase/tetratricopeptide (TPR) repeat protein